LIFAGVAAPLYIAENEVREFLTYAALIPAIRQALIDLSAGRVEQPPRTILRTGTGEGIGNGWFAVMPVIAGDFMAVKTVTFYPGNAERGLHTHMAVVELLSRASGEPLALMDGRLITEMRTAAVSAVALDALGSQTVTSLGILGSGVQARAHLAALRHVRPGLGDIRIWSRTPEKAQALADEFGAADARVDGAGARAVPIEEAAGADVVLTATSSAVPVLEGRWLAPQAVVLAVGATGATLRELDDELMHDCYLVAESRAAVERESGDVRLSGARVQAEIGEILGQAAAVPQEQRILFKSVGLAIEDLTAARLVWQARAEGLR
jgi:ornithine cyclodeaminase/alanine dehydrogenase-like protein (mu-crystallin family)